MGFSSSLLLSSSDDLSDLTGVNGDSGRELFSGVLIVYTDDSLSTYGRKYTQKTISIDFIN